MRGSVWFGDDLAAPDRPRSGDLIEGGPEFELASKQDSLGWNAEIRSTGEHFLYGSALPR